jgi:hypothetical protein
LSCGRLADAGLHDIAKVKFLDDGGVNLGLFKSTLESNDAEFGCGKGFKAAVEGADWGAGSRDNNNFVRAVRRLFRELRKTGK